MPRANISELKSTTVEISISCKTSIYHRRFVWEEIKLIFVIFPGNLGHFDWFLTVLFGIRTTKLFFYLVELLAQLLFFLFHIANSSFKGYKDYIPLKKHKLLFSNHFYHRRFNFHELLVKSTAVDLTLDGFIPHSPVNCKKWCPVNYKLTLR